MIPRVYYSSARDTSKLNNLKRIERLFSSACFEKLFRKGDRTAVKMHWGEPGNTTYIPPPFIATLVSQIKKTGAKPFVTDTSTIYTGGRHDAISNLESAAFNGFTPQSVGAPIIVADGLCGSDRALVNLDGNFVKEAKIAGSIFNASSMMVVSHFKGHIVFSFGGALKNLGMGCATSAGKQVLHSDLKASVDRKLCNGDSMCIRKCPAQCISLDLEHKAIIDPAACIGCGECLAVCPARAIQANWKTTSEAIQGKTAEYALAAVKGKEGKVGYLNFLINITAECDCSSWSGARIVQDIGFLASTDPVAIDRASIDLFNKAPVLPDSELAGMESSPDKLRVLYPKIDYEILLKHAEKIGLGSNRYELVKVDT